MRVNSTWMSGLLLGLLACSAQAAVAVRHPTPTRYTLDVAVTEENAQGEQHELWRLRTPITAEEVAANTMDRSLGHLSACPAPACLGATVDRVNSAFLLVPVGTDRVNLKSEIALETTALSAAATPDRHWGHAWRLTSQVDVGQPVTIANEEDRAAGTRLKLTVTVNPLPH